MQRSKNSSTPTVQVLAANGKLLLSGEYLVIAGARALAMPLRFGQEMTVMPSAHPELRWESHCLGKPWFSARFELPDFSILESDDAAVAQRLQAILRAAGSISEGFLSCAESRIVRTEASYPLEWGLGSSSTLISLIARWAGINVFDLFHKTSRGSGYDIACADRKEPLYFQLRESGPDITTVIPGEGLRRYTYFAYLGRKQDSAAEVSRFLENAMPSTEEIETVSSLSERIALAPDYPTLAGAIMEHEALLGRILDKECIGSARFAGFPGAVKSLGAWGGDFALFASELPAGKVFTALKSYGLHEVFTFDEIKALR